MDNILYGLSCFACFVLYVYVNKNEAISKINAVLLELATQAELAYGNELGQLKKALVISKIINSEYFTKLPLFIKYFLSEKKLSQLIDDFIANVFNKMRESNKVFDQILKQ